MAGVFELLTNALTGANTSNATAETKQALSLLSDLARAKCDLFEKSIADTIRTAGTTDNATAPIEAVIAITNEIYAMKSVDAKAITDTVQAVVNTITSDSTANKAGNISTMVGKIVGGILGESSGSESEKRKYIVFTEGLSIVRLDMHVWTKQVTSTGLMTMEMERVVALSLFKSTVDISKVKLNTFLSLYQNQLEDSTNATPTQISKNLEEAKKVYNFFHS